MFRSTYGYIHGYLQFSEPILNHYLSPMAKDLEREIEVFEIGVPVAMEAPFDGRIYCLKMQSAHIAFVVKSTKVVSHVAMSEFNRGKHRYIDPRAKFPVVEVEISNLGSDLKSIAVDRGFLSYHDVWQGQSTRHSFSSGSEKTRAFECIQEALPVLFFDDYANPSHPNPRLCSKVMPIPEEGIDAVDSSGSIESRSVVLRATTDEPEAPAELFARLEAKNRRRVMLIDEFMAEVIDVERGNLFYGHFYLSTLTRQPRFWKLLKEIYAAHYSQYFDCFEGFLLFVVQIASSRETSRSVYERYSPMLPT